MPKDTKRIQKNALHYIYKRGTGLPAEKAEAIEDALLAAVKALPFPADDIFRGTGDGTREYTALFTLQR